jgi:hypothetical protein
VPVTGAPSGDGVYRLEVPADPAHIATARLFVSALARRLDDGNDDVVEDAKLTVSEIVTAIIERGRSPVIEIRVSTLGGVTLSIGPWHGENDHTEYGALDIAQTLFPATRVDGSWVVVPVEAPEDG